MQLNKSAGGAGDNRRPKWGGITFQRAAVILRIKEIRQRFALAPCRATLLPHSGRGYVGNPQMGEAQPFNHSSNMGTEGMNQTLRIFA